MVNKMTKEKDTITVLNDFDGLNPVVIEEITRTIQHGGHRDKRGRPQPQPKFVSYKGVKCSVFVLSKSYGLKHGLCISVN